MTVIDKNKKRSFLKSRCFEMFQIIHQVTNRTEDILMVTKDVISGVCCRWRQIPGVKRVQFREEQTTGLVTKQCDVEAVMKVHTSSARKKPVDIDVRFLISSGSKRDGCKAEGTA
uniref:Uncharacterized protein n=1 Tax=Sphaerodactylus townsendi TaxID=933632 RepID=A0ACB8E5F1_9SAUR